MQYKLYPHLLSIVFVVLMGCGGGTSQNGNQGNQNQNDTKTTEQNDEQNKITTFPNSTANYQKLSGDADPVNQQSRCTDIFPQYVHLEQKGDQLHLMGKKKYLRGSIDSKGSITLTGILKESNSIPGNRKTVHTCSGGFVNEDTFNISCEVQLQALATNEIIESVTCNNQYKKSTLPSDGLIPRLEDIEGIYSDFANGQAVDNTEGVFGDCRLTVGNLTVNLEDNKLYAEDRALMSGELPNDKGETSVTGDQTYVGLGKRYEESYQCELKFIYLENTLQVIEHCTNSTDFFDLATGDFLKTTQDNCYALAKKS